MRSPSATTSIPKKEELLNLLELLEVNLSSLIRRWRDGVSPEIREEVMTQAYEPVLKMLVRARRRRGSTTIIGGTP